MAKLYRLNSTVEFKIDDIIVGVRPLSYDQKMEVQSEMSKAVNGDMSAAMQAVIKVLKVALRKIEGVTYDDEDGNEVDFKLEFDQDGNVEQHCIDDLLNLPHSQKLTTLCTSLLNGIPDKVLNEKGDPLEGVSRVKPKAAKKGK